MVTKTKARPRPAARPKPKSAGVKPRAPARTPAPRPKPKSQVKTTGNVDYYRPFVTITQGFLKRISPFLTFLLTPTAVADGTITAKDQKRLETYFRDIPSEDRQKRRRARSHPGLRVLSRVPPWSAAGSRPWRTIALATGYRRPALARSWGVSMPAWMLRSREMRGSPLRLPGRVSMLSRGKSLCGPMRRTRRMLSTISRAPTRLLANSLGRGSRAIRSSNRPLGHRRGLLRARLRCLGLLHRGNRLCRLRCLPRSLWPLRRNCLRRSRSPLRSIGGRLCSTIVS